MPPEPLPWDRKEYVFKDHREYDGGAPGADALNGSGECGSPSSGAQWRDTYHSPRYFTRFSPLRALPGQCRQGGGYHPVCPEDFGGHGFTPSQSDKFWSEEESFRLPSSGRYGSDSRSSSRDDHVAFRRSPHWDSSDFSLRQNHEAHATAHRLYYRDHSLDSASWKPPLKWSRPGNLCLTRTGGYEITDTVLQVAVHGEKEIAPKYLVEPPLPSDEGPPQKKPRLGWGQGLAMYEKQKVEGWAYTSESGAKGSLSDTSPKVAGLSGFPSSATPCSANCSFSPGFAVIVEDRPDVKSLTDHDEKCHRNDLTGESSDDTPIKYDHLESDHASALSSLLASLLQSDDVCPMGTALSRHSILNKLLILKENISKELEKTECVIDRFENELKAPDCGARDLPHQSVVTALESSSEPCEQLSNATSKFPHWEIKNASTSCTELQKESLHCSNLEQKTDVEANNGSDGPEPENTSRCCLDDCLLSPEVEKSKVLESQHSNPSDRCEKSSVIASESANKDDSEQASMWFGVSLCANPPTYDIWELVDLSTVKKNDLHVKEKLAIRKRLTKFKEKALVLKFKALRFLWKEDMHLLSLRKHRNKSNKHFEPAGCLLQSGDRKQRSSIKSTRFALPGNLTLVPNTEMSDLASKLLFNSDIKRYRNNLKMPALLLNEERICARFGMHNGLIEDPCSFENEKTMINPWSQEEKEVFMELLATFGKDFTKISSYLQHKTTADCIEFYYKYHKYESFKEVKKRLGLRKTHKRPAVCTYLVPSGKKWNIDNSATIDLPKLDSNVDSLDLLGAAWTLASHNHVTARNQPLIVNSGYNDGNMSYETCNYVERQNNNQLVGHTRESLNADAVSVVRDVPSSEIKSTYATSSHLQAEQINQGAVSPDFKTEVYENFDEDSYYDEGCVDLDSPDWTDDEKSIFMLSLSTCGKDFARIASCVGTRSREQCKIFYSKARKCLGLDKIHQDIGTRNVPLSDTDGGRSDTDDGCTVEMDSTICDINSCSKTKADLSDPGVNIHVGHALSNFIQTEAEELMGGTSLNKNDTVDKKALLSPNAMELNDRESSQCSIIPSVDAASICVGAVTQYDNAACANHEIKVIGSNSSIGPNESDQDELNQLNISFIQHEYSGGSVLVVNREVESKSSSVPECVLMNKEQANIDFSNSSSSFCIAVGPNRNETGMVQGNNIGRCPQTTFVPNHQHQVQLDLHDCLQKNAQDFPKLENACPLPLDTWSDPLSISLGGNLSMPSQSTLNFEGYGNRRVQNVRNDDFHRQCMVKSPSVDVDRHLHILRDRPLQSLIQEKRMEAGAVSGNQVLLETRSNKNGLSHSTRLLSDIHGNNHNISSISSSRSAVLCPLNENKPESQIRPCIQNPSCDTDAHGSCDVKLFGTVLSHSSSSQNLSFSAHENNSNPQSSPVPRSSNSNSSSSITYAFSCGKSSHASSMEKSVRSCNFWNGNRLQTGLSLLPESTLMLTKYHGSLVGRTPCNNRLLTDHQQSYMTQSESDGKCVLSCGEMQKKNGVEMISRFSAASEANSDR